MLRSFFKRFRRKAPVRVAVDLTRLGRGGQNGGIKPFLFEFFRWMEAARGSEFVFVYFTRSSLVPEVEALRREVDWQICVGESEGVAVENLKIGKSGNLKTSDGIAGWRRRWPADVLYAPLGFSVLRDPGLPWISLIVDTLHRDVPEAVPASEGAFRDEWIRDGVANADAVQCITEFVSGKLQKYYGAKAEKIFVTHCVVAEGLSRSSDQRLGSQPLHPNSPYFFYPANDWPHKNHRALLEAYAVYRREAGVGAWDLVLSGHFTRPEVLREKIEVLGLGGSCRFLGHVEPGRFAEIFKSAGALVFPSLHEGFGIPVLEAMALGVPVACSRAGSLPEVAGEAALYFDPEKVDEIAKALGEIARDEGLRGKLIEAGKRRAKDFVIGKEAGKLADRLVEIAAR